MIKLLTTLFLSLLITVEYSAQCECTDCPINIPNSSTVSSFLDISGASNNTLGSNGQQLCMVCINLVYDAIQELDMILIAPSGDQVSLMVNTGLAVNDNITFEICFVSCDQNADPDPGFPDVFDTDAGYQPNESYDGVYYPAVGCFDDLTGDVNGTWELEMTDNVFADNGDLLDWYMVFTDDTGIGCANAGDCSNSISCIANGGELDSPDPVDACEGDAILNLDIPVSYPNGGEPPAADYDYTYVIVELPDQVVSDITSTTDLSGFPPGTYQICGLSYLSDDASDLPAADGSLTYDDIQDQIDAGDYCADLSDNCITINIDEDVTAPNFTGPTDVCVDELVIYEILDYDPDITYTIFISSGSFSFFIENDGIIELIWISGPGEICVIAESICGDEETCLMVNVGDAAADFDLQGDFSPCPGDTELYNVIPGPPLGGTYLFTVSGGTIINQADDNLEVEWQTMEGTGEICVELQGTICPVEIVCEEIDIALDYSLPAGFNAPDELCFEQDGTASISDDINIIDYFWTTTNGLVIVDGQGFNAVDISGTAVGLASLCLEVTTACGVQGPICEEIDILPVPEPEIIDPEQGCGFELNLEAITFPGNSLEWITVSGPDDVQFNPVDEGTTVATFPLPGQYEIGLTESNEACSTTALLVIEVSGELLVSEESFDCDLDNNYTVSFEILSGSPPYTVNGVEISGNQFTSELFSSTDPYSFSIMDAQSCAVDLEGEFECPCISDAGDMEAELLTACISSGEPVQAEWQEDGEFDNDDTGLYFLHDGEDAALGFVYSFNDTGLFFYTPELVPGQIYYISYVVGNALGSEIDLSDPCLSVSVGQPVQFIEDPVLELTIDSLTCESTATINAMPDGILVSDWSQVSGPGNSMISFNGGFPFNISASEAGTYQFAYSLSNETCTVADQIEISFLDEPQILSIMEDCGGGSDAYRVRVVFSGGQAPYSSSIPGSFTDSLFISEPVANGEAYSFTISDSVGCSSLLISGQKLCNCLSDSGTLPMDTLVLCGTLDSVQIPKPADALLDTNDLAVFYLHRSALFNTNERIDSSLSGNFGFIPDSMSLDTVYFISYIVANESGQGQDFTDPCLSISNSQPVMWNSYPEVYAGEDGFSCGPEYILQASPTPGRWRLIEEPLSGALQIEDDSNPESVIRMDETGSYTLSWESANGICSSRDTVIVRREAVPVIESILQSCNDDLESYELQIDFPMGAQYIIDGDTYTGSFLIPGLDSDSSFQLIISNEAGCETLVDIDPVDCSCPSSSGTLSSTSQELCLGEDPELSLFNTDFVLGGGDSLVYILHDGTFDNIGNILQQSPDQIIYTEDLIAGKTYIINRILASFTGDQLDFSDPCTQVSDPLSVVWLPDNIIGFPSDAAACVGSDFELEFTVSERLPVSLLLISNLGDSLELELVNAVSSISYPAGQNLNSIRVELVSGVCTPAIDSEIAIDAVEEVPPEFQEIIEICNNPVFGSELALDDLITGPVPPGQWDAGSLPVTNNNIDFDGLDAGSYLIAYTTEGFSMPCPGDRYELTVTVLDCICPELSFSDLELCQEDAGFDLGQYDTGGFEGNWNLFPNDGQTNIPVADAQNVLRVASAEEGRYTVVYTIDDPAFPDPCQKDFEFELTLYKAMQAGAQNIFPQLCESDNEMIDLFALLDNADEGGTWIYKGIEIENPVSSSLFDTGTNTVFYQLDPSGPCPEMTTELVIERFPVPAFSLESEDVLCFGEANGSISIILENENEEIRCFLNDILQSGSKIIEGLTPGSYELYIENDYCRSESRLIEITEPDPISISLGEDRVVNIDEEVIIRALTNVLESDIEEISWSDLSGILQTNELELREKFNNDNTISVELTDENGCVAIDEIRIRIIQPDIYIPNIFSINSFNNNNFGIGNPESVELIQSLSIFDRWGNKVFDIENTDPFSDDARWDGYFNNDKAQEGVYVYVFDLLLKTGERRILSGDLTLIW